MRRVVRLDTPGLLHHVMIRGIERRKIFRVGVDREDPIDNVQKWWHGDNLMVCENQ